MKWNTMFYQLPECYIDLLDDIAVDNQAKQSDVIVAYISTCARIMERSGTAAKIFNEEIKRAKAARLEATG